MLELLEYMHTEILRDAIFRNDEFDIFTVDVQEAGGSYPTMVMVPYFGIRDGDEILRFADIVRHPGLVEYGNMASDAVMAGQDDNLGFIRV
jgi:hypothetical protein